jgi:hypothetical protein
MAAAKPSRPAVKKLEKKLDKAIVSRDRKGLEKTVKGAVAIKAAGTPGTSNRAARLGKRMNQSAKATGKPSKAIPYKAGMSKAMRSK